MLIGDDGDSAVRALAMMVMKKKFGTFHDDYTAAAAIVDLIMIFERE